HRGRGVDVGIDKIIDGLMEVREMSQEIPVIITFETTAGSGNQIGSNIEELSELIDRAKSFFDTGLCIDTAHLFASGYDISDEDGYEKLIDKIDNEIGIKRLLVCHINDSKVKLGSKKDRHEHIGKGMIGLSVFRRILKDKRIENALAILETPKGIRPDDGLSYDRINVGLLKRLRDE
ncbi:MAG: deoxyribonuclease IV, partial [Myxococcota bacterium]